MEWANWLRPCKPGGSRSRWQIGLATRLSIMARSHLAIVQADLGAGEAALKDGQMAVAQADELRHVVIQTNARRSLAYVLLQQEDWARALPLHEQCVELIKPTENRWEPLMLGVNYAEALLSAGRPDQAAEVISGNLNETRQARSRHWEAIGLRVQGQIFAECKQWDEAAEAFGQAVAILEELGSQLELGRALEHRGAMWQSRGNVAAARDDLVCARSVLESCGWSSAKS